MLTILGGADSGKNLHCDGISRRGFLKVGGMALGGLSLPQLLEAESAAGTGSSHKAVINIYLPGGPSHIDFWDLKPDAPREIRGEFNPIKTNVPGMEICELFPRLAKIADKFSIIRSIVGAHGAHDGYQCMTGRTKGEQPPLGGWPALGAWVSKVQGPAVTGVPPHLSLMYSTGNRTWGEPGTGGFIGAAHAPIGLVARKGQSSGPAVDMVLKDMPLERLRNRELLRRSLDGFKRSTDQKGAMEGIDHYNLQAFDILTSSGLAKALDLSDEDPETLERYGENDTKYQRDGAPKMIRNFLVARRLVEAGARVVSLNYSRWDWHGGDGMNFPRSRQEFPLLDKGLSALITDLHDRGLDKDVSVVVWGEFGRTPKINKNNSRDHWPQVSFALLAGGGMRNGQVIGATNSLGEYAKDRPVTFQEVFATLYHNLGINVQTATVTDNSGRPHYLVDSGVNPIGELV
ncbi:MAG: DUF1501 domain-containing protein [Planctomycetota bacterium]|nr:DUF1501 domain-containing protein [Planctomycetota bacterium]MEE3200303.1 DUF1501 domain-containing protein [Planctomycetota bacterium]